MREDDYKFPYLPSAAAEQYLSGMATPPLHALASVPFKWEEQPGKPRPCTDIILRPEPAKCLELPPCRGRLMTKMPSPTTVLDGPYNLGRPRFSSFRLFLEKQSSFDSSSSGGGGGCSPESEVRYGDHVAAGKKSSGRRRMNRLFSRSLRARRGYREGSFGFSPASFDGFDSAFVEEKKKMRKRNESSSVWVTMYESLKKAMAWKRTRKWNTPILNKAVR